MSKYIDTQFLRKLRILAFFEGISTLILFGVAMPLKYFGDMPIAVTIAGSIHGALFILLSSMSLIAINKVPIGFRLGISVLVGAVVPFGPFVVDRSLKKLGMLVHESEGPAST